MPNVCVVCSKDDKNDLFRCDRCRSPHHAGCADLTRADVYALQSSNRKVSFWCAGCMKAANQNSDLVKMMLEMRKEIASLKTAPPPSLHTAQVVDEPVVAGRQLLFLLSRKPESTADDADERKNADATVLQSLGLKEESVSTKNFDIVGMSNFPESKGDRSNTIIDDVPESNPPNITIQEEIVLDADEKMLKNDEHINNENIGRSNITGSEFANIGDLGTNGSRIIINGNLPESNPPKITIQEEIIFDDEEEMVNNEERSHNVNISGSNITSSESLKIEDLGMKGSGIVYNGNLDQHGYQLSAPAYSHNSTHHTRSHNGKKRFRCSVCGKSYTTKSNLNIHLRVHSGERPFECAYCNKKFTEKNKMADHIRLHTGEKPFQCALCGKTYATKSSLTPHLRMHSGEKPFKCNECGKSFTSTSNLNAHLRLHGGEKPFICAVCGKTFAVKDTLIRHIRIHSGEKPFKCSKCGKAFSQASGLKIHIRSHSEERPFKCTVCGKSFNHKPNLKVHLSSHNVGAPFECNECGKFFKTKHSSYIHYLRFHSGETPFKCTKCGKAFKYNCDFKRHSKVHSRNKP